MNGAFHAPPLTVPSVFADRQSRRESPKMASRPFQFLEKNAPKSERERPSTLRDWPPCPPIQRDGGWRSRPGVNPFISALTVTRCLADFPGVWPQLRDILFRSPTWEEGRGLSYTPCLLTKPALCLCLRTTQSQTCFPAASNVFAYPAATAFSQQRRQSV